MAILSFLRKNPSIKALERGLIFIDGKECRVDTKENMLFDLGISNAEPQQSTEGEQGKFEHYRFTANLLWLGETKVWLIFKNNIPFMLSASLPHGVSARAERWNVENEVKTFKTLEAYLSKQAGKPSEKKVQGTWLHSQWNYPNIQMWASLHPKDQTVSMGLGFNRASV